MRCAIPSSADVKETVNVVIPSEKTRQKPGLARQYHCGGNDVNIGGSCR
jgi:hypothetical protein